LDANNKSGVATKYRLVVGAKVVDADYQGEVHLNLINTSNETVTIRSGQKIVQFIHKEYIDTQWEEITNDQYDQIEVSDRGTGGFASTGEK
jgi:dUTP pyrophosphatase